MQLNLATVQKEEIEALPREAMQVLELLEQIENHTASLRKDIIAEMTADQNSIKLRLDQV
jgi:hypothetical protein